MDPNMQSIINLYSSILIPILSEWINEWELCHLDCAVTQSKLRQYFLRQLSQCTVANVMMRNECYYSKFEWFLLRQICVRNLDLNVHEVQPSVDVHVLSRVKRLNSVTSHNGLDLLKLLKLCPVVCSIKIKYIAYSTLIEILSTVQGLESVELQSISDLPDDGSLKFGSHLISFLSINNRTHADNLIDENPKLISLEVWYDGTAESVPSALGQLTHLKLRCYSKDFWAPKILWNNPHLLALSLISINVSDDYVIELVHHCPALTCLEVSGSITDEGLIKVADCCLLLRKLRIGTEITDDGLIYFVSRHNKIISLNIEGCRSVTDVGVSAILLHCCNLTHLNVRRGSRFFNSFKGVLTACPCLTKLDASSFVSILPIIRSMEYLQVTSESVVMAPKWHSTRFVSLESSFHVMAVQYTEMLQYSPGLLELIIGDDKVCNDTLVMCALEHCRGLTSLSIRKASKYCVDAIALSGLLLKKLQFSSAALDDNILLPLIQSQPQLRKLSMPSVTGYSDKSLIALAQYCSKLSSVTIDNKNITDRGVNILLRSCSLLQSIDLFASITVSVLDTISHLNRDMTLVNISGCGISVADSEAFMTRIQGHMRVTCLLNSD